jgi:DNA-binding response OmpR family regulator
MAAERPTRAEAHAALVLHRSATVVELVIGTLNHGLFDVRGVRSLADAEALLGAWHADFAVVDLDHEDADELLKLLDVSPATTSTGTPVLALTARSDLHTRLRAFDLGVDDVLTTPFAPQELVARAKVIARRGSGGAHQVVPTIRIGETEIDIANREVRRSGRAVRLTRIEQGLLRGLAANAGRTVTRDELLDTVWGQDHVPESNVVDRHLRDVRLKLGDSHHRPTFIETVPGRGYRFLPVYANGGWQARGGDARRSGPRGGDQRAR